MSKWGRMLTALILTAALCLGAVSAAAQGVLTLPSAVKEIQAEAFAGAQGVDKIVLPDGVLVIGSRAFAGSSVAQINLPAGLTDIAQDAFADCDVLAAVEEGSYAQAWCEANGVRYMFDIDATPEEYFDYVVVNGKARVTDYTGSDVNVVIPPMMGGYPVTAMERTFDNNDEIVTVVLPSTLKTLGGYTFWGCDNLRSVTFNSDITAIGEFEFFQCRVLEDFMLPESVTKIGTRAFAGCHGLTKLPFGGHVKTIGESAFEEGWGFTEIEIPDGVQTIGARAFADGQYLKKVIVPESVTSIGANAFASCHRDFALYGVSGSYAQTYAEANGLRFVALDEIVPVEFTYVVNEMGTFVNGYTGTATQIVIPASIDGVKMDGVWNWAFKDNTEITGVTLSEGLTMIGGEAFRGCTALERVTLPESLTTISAAAFRECTALEEIVLPDNATLGWGVFYDCANLNSVTLPANLTAIPAYAFRGCSLLISAPIPAGVTEIGEYAFCACYNLRGVQIPAGVTAIGEHAFDECEMIDEIILPETLQTLGGNAFYSAGSLQRVEFNSDITEIGEFTFFQCVNLKDIQLPSSVTSIGTSAFVGCNGLTTLPFGEGVVTIGERAFAECYYLTEIEIPETVTTIGARAFSFCYDLKKATIPATVTEIGELAFHNNDESFTIYGYTGSAAETFAKNNDIPFVAIGAVTPGEPDDPEIEETPATSFSYMIDDGKATILQFIGSETDVVIPAKIEDCPVTSVNSGAFYGAAVESVVFPESVWEIGEYCFSMCERLESVTITAATETIGANIFNECPDVTVYGAENSYAHLYTQRWGVPFVATSHLPALTSSYYLTTDGDEATILFYTGSVADLVIPDNIDGYTITGIGNYAFTDVDGLTKITLPSTLKVIGKHAFSYTALKEIEIPDGVFNIGPSAFRECSSLTKATIPASVTNITSNAFRDCGDNFTIYGYTGSRAESFASEQNYLFVALDGGEEPEETDFEFGYNDDLTELWVTAYNGTDEIVTVPAEYDGLPVTKVTYGAFQDNETVRQIILPDSIREIDYQAFAFCANLEEINLPEGMIKVGYFVFNGCTNLKNVTLPSTLTVLDDGAFQSCASLTEMTVPEGVTELSDSAFMSCTALEKITLPSTITRIGVSAFSNDAALAQINLPQGLTDIDDYAFYGCESLTQMQLPGGVTHIGEFAFANCEGLTSLTLPEGLTELERYTFSGCDALTALDIPDSVTVIGEYAVANCDGLTSLTLPANLETIGNYAFYGCGNYYLQAIELPASVKTIGDYAFQFCSGLTSATIYSTDAVFGSSAFANCQNLTICGYAGSTAEAYASASGIPFTALGGGEPEEPEEPETPAYTYVIEYNFTAAITGYTGTETELVLPEELGGYPVGFIGNYAFENRADLTKITLPSTLGRIGVGAFAGCTGLEEIEIPAGVTEIADSAFWGCTGLKEIEFPGSVTSIGGFAFASCSGLTKATIPASVTSIGERAFYECAASFAIHGYTGSYAQTYAGENGHPFVALDAEPEDPEGEQTEGDYTYTVENGKATVVAYTGSDADVVIPAALGGYPVERIGEYAFEAKTLTTVIIPEGVTEIGMGAFYWCENLRAAAIPASIVNIGDRAFSSCHADLIITGTAGTIAQNHAWENAIGFADAATGEILFNNDFAYTVENGVATLTLYTGDDSELVVPAQYEGYTVGALRWGVLQQCDTLTKVTVEARVPEIPRAAFQNCDLLVEVTLPDSVTSIAANAFRWCYKLEAVHIPASVTSIDATAFDECDADLTIYGEAGSYAQTYAGENGIPFVALDAEPEDPQGEQTEGDYTYTVENGKATIVAYTGSDADVVIPAALGGYPVERIGEYAFEAKTLTTVIIPEGVTEIGMGAFYWCESLRAAAIPASIANIADRAFSSCHSDLIITGARDSVAQAHAWSNAIGFADAATGEILFNNDFAYTVENGVATLTLYTGDDSELVVPAQYEGYTVGALRWGVLQQCDTLTKVTIGARVPEIPRAAFQNCDLLVEVTLPDSVTSIAANAFRWCYKLETVHIPASVTSIDATAFDECDADLTIYGEAGSYAQTYAAEHGIAFVAVGGEEPEEPGEATENGFTYTVEGGKATITAYAGGQVEVVIPAALGGYPVETIGAGAFKGDTTLCTVILPEGMKTIGEEAFANCTALNTVDLPVSLESVGAHAFDGCSALNFVEFEKNVTFVGEDAFAGCGEGLFFRAYVGTAPADYADAHDIFYEYNYDECYEGDYVYNVMGSEAAIVAYTGSNVALTIPATLGGYPVTMIAPEAFAHRLDITSVVFPEGLTLIATNAFAYCANLTSVSFPSTLIEFYGSAFTETGLTEIILPENMDYIGFYAFEGCKDLTKVTVLSRDVAFERLVFSNGSENLVIHGYTGSTAEAHAAAQGIPFVALDAPVTPEPEVTPKPTPDPSQPYEENGYTYYYLPEEQAVSISSYSGSDQDLVIPSTLGGYPVVQIGMHAFSFKDTLRTVTIPYGVKRILTSAIKSCPNLTSVSMPESVTELGGNVFAQCPALTSVNLPSGLTAIGEALFEGCSALESVEIPAGVVSIGDYAFYACTSLKRADIPAGVVSIGSNAFANCGVLQNVTIPQGVTRIEEYAFYACDGLTQIDIHDNITYIGSTAFYGCDGLTSVTIPEQVTELGDYAFYGCTKLDSVTIENPALVFGANAFDYFYKLTIYGYTGSTAQTYAQANGAAFVAMDGGSEEPDVPVVPPAEEPEFDYFCDGYTVTIDGYNGSDTNVVIPATIEGCPVTEISSYAFQFNTALTSVVIPDSVEILGDSCFEGCSALASVSLGSGLKQIGMNAFSGCTALTGLTLPEGLEMIGEAAFISSGLTEITVPKSVYQLGANAFRYNYAMTEATIKGDLGYLSDFAFIGSTALRKVTITGGVSAIGEMAFGSCSALEEITIPASVTQIADNAFSGAAEDFTIYGYYGSYAQTYAVMHGYTFIVLEAGPMTPEEPEEPEEPIESFYTNGYTYILRDGNAMIVGYNGEDTKPVVPDTLGDYPVAAIEERAFKGTAISEVTLPESLTHIGPNVFENCDQLYRVRVLSRTTTFDDAAFNGAGAHLTILCYSDSTALAHALEMGIPYSLLDSIDGEYTDGDWSWTIENGETTITKYTGTAQEIYLNEMIEGSPIVAIGESAFASNTDLIKIVLPDGLKSIGKRAFKYCSKLQEIELPDSVTGLGTEEAFAYCSGLKSVKLSAGLTAISTRAFIGCTSLTSIVIPEGVKQIGPVAFSSCRNLKSVTLPESLRGIYLSAFSYCSGLTEIRIPDGVSMIDSSAFSDCTKLAKVTLPKNLTSIEGNTFKNCTALTSIELPISLTNIGTYAFSGSGLTEIDIPGNVTSIGTYAFSDCTNLTDIAVPNGVAQIMDGFAKGCTALTSIDLLDGVTSIGHYAFNGCTAMWGATIPQTVTSIGEYVFDGTAENFAIFGYEDSYAQTYALEKGFTFVALGRDETLYTDFDYVIEDGEVCITQYNGSEAEVVVPYVIEGYQVTKIGELAFFGLNHITSVKIPSSVIDIGHQAFSFCGNLTNVEIPAADAEIYEDAFQCSHHALVITGVKDSTACAHALAFGIGFRDAATGEVLFDNDYGYTVIDGEVRINAYTGIEKDVIVPSVIEGYPVFELGAVAMMRNDYMTSLTVPSSVRMINGAMAQYCYNLEEIHLSEGLECIYDGAFRGCDSLSRIIIPESVIRIGDRAFHGCSMLASATIPAGVTNIGEDVFAEVAEGFTIYGYSGSAAEAYAAARSIPFVALDAQLPEVETLEAICPWSAGSVSDSVLRAFGAALVNEAGVEQVTYSNLTGAGGVIGHQAIADAQADGKTLGMITTELSMYAPMNTASLTYASVDPLCILSVDAAAVLVNAQWAADNGITDMSSFLAYCEANPDSVRMAVSSTGSVWHLAGGYLEKKTGVDLALMNYADGAATSIQNAALGMDHGVITSLPNAAPYINSGDLVCLGVMGTERDDFYPAYKTCTEQGYALVYGAWRGIAAPKDLSASMKAALEASCRTAVQSESFAATMAGMGCNVNYMDAEEAEQFLRQNYLDTFEAIQQLGL